MKTHTINEVEWTEDQMRVAIAKACGWKFRLAPNASGWRNPDGKLSMLPDYLGDLNAMREAERVVHEAGLWRSYVNWLKDICGEPQTKAYSCQTHVGADAPQRAIAFIQTMKLKPE